MAGVIFALVALGASAAAGLLVALLAKRIHGGLPFFRMWLFYSVLTALFVAFVIALVLF